MAQKSPIMLHSEAQNALIQTINYFLQQGVPSYEMKSIIDSMLPDLNALVEQDMKKAEAEYNAALEAEKAASENNIEAPTKE